jgi:hypothetical protein
MVHYMAQRVQALFIDDIDGGEAEGTVRFALDGPAHSSSAALATISWRAGPSQPAAASPRGADAIFLADPATTWSLPAARQRPWASTW